MLRMAIENMARDGISHARVTEYPERRMLLLDGWKTRPDEEAPPEPPPERSTSALLLTERADG